MRRLRSSPPPSSGNRSLDIWLQQVADALNGLPAFSVFSGNPATSGVTADAGTLGIDVSAVTTARLWINHSGTTSSWATLLY